MSGKHEGRPDDVTRIQARQDAQEQLQVPKASWNDFFRHYAIPKNGLLLLGTAGSWFCLDVACKLISPFCYVSVLLRCLYIIYSC